MLVYYNWSFRLLLQKKCKKKKKKKTGKNTGKEIVSDFLSAKFFVPLRPLTDRIQISLLILTKFKGINLLLFPLKSSEILRFLDNFRGNKS